VTGRIGVVILCYGAGRAQLELVASLRAEGVNDSDIVLVHNPDGSASGDHPAGPEGVQTIVMKQNLGYGPAMNAGIEHWARQDAEWVLLLTNDILPRPGSVRTLFEAAAGSEDAGVLGPVLERSDDSRPYSYGGIDHPDNITIHRVDEPSDREDPIAACDWVDGSAMLVRVAAVCRAGKLEERFFMYFEEADLCRRVRHAGWKVGVVLAARMATSPGQTRRPLAYGFLFARNGLRYAGRARGRRGILEALGSQLRMSWWLLPKPYQRRFYDHEQLRFGASKALGIWLGIGAALVGQTGPPPRFIRRLSDISGTEPGAAAPQRP
jgi:GT2 family glycosyltransferase